MTQVEDRAYPLMNLLDVNMRMLYGERKKAFHRLQLEIIRSSDDQSIFAWGHNSDVQIGSILADDPSFFKGCSKMELIDHGSSLKDFQKVGEVSRGVIVAISRMLCDGKGMNVVGGSVWCVEARSQGCQPCKQKEEEGGSLLRLSLTHPIPVASGSVGASFASPSLAADMPLFPSAFSRTLIVHIFCVVKPT